VDGFVAFEETRHEKLHLQCGQFDAAPGVAVGDLVGFVRIHHVFKFGKLNWGYILAFNIVRDGRGVRSYAWAIAQPKRIDQSGA